MAHEISRPITDTILTSGYSDLFSLPQREAHSEALEEVVGLGTPWIEVTESDDSATTLSIVSQFTPELLTAYCASLFLSEVHIRSVDLFSGTLVCPQKRRYSKYRASSPTSHEIMVARFVLQMRKRSFDSHASARIIDRLLSAANEMRKQVSVPVDYLLDGYTRGVQAQSEMRTVSGVNARPSEVEVDCGENGEVRIRKLRSPAYPFHLSLLLYAADLRAFSFRYHQRGRMETVRFSTVGDRRLLQRLENLLKLFPDFYESLAYAPDPLKAVRRLHELAALLEDEPWLSTSTVFGQKVTRDSIYRISGSSDFIWADFLHSTYTPLQKMLSRMNRDRSVSPTDRTVRARIRALQQEEMAIPQKYDNLNKYKDYALFAIQLQYLIRGSPDVGTLAKQLTTLADLVISAFAELVYRELVEQYGEPLGQTGTPIPFCVYGLGKLAGRALGFASDLELLFIFGNIDGEDISPAVTDFFSKLVRRFLVVFKTKSNGIFEPDMRLRPYGKKGNPATSAGVFVQYYSPDGASHALERFALCRMRRIYGSQVLHGKIDRKVKEFFTTRGYIRDDEMRAVRTAQMHQSGESFHIKRSEGALTDLETIVQFLQVEAFPEKREVWTPALYKALSLLEKHGRISRKERLLISEAYYLYRRVVTGLRVLRGASDNLELHFSENPDLAPLARRAGYRRIGMLAEAEQLTADLRLHSAGIRALAVRRLRHRFQDDHPIHGIEDFLHRPSFEYVVLARYFKNHQGHVAAFMTAGFHSLFSLLNPYRLSKYVLVILGDAVVGTCRPDVTCTRATILLKRRLETSNDVELWAARPERLRLMITMLGAGRTYFYQLLAHPELTQLFFLSSRDIDRWYHRNIEGTLITVFRKASENTSVLSRLLPMKQKFDFFLALFTLDGTISLRESRHLYREFVIDLVGRLTLFLTEEEAGTDQRGILRNWDNFVVCFCSSNLAGGGIFDTMSLFILYSEEKCRKRNPEENDLTKETYLWLLRRLQAILSEVRSEGFFLRISNPEIDTAHPGVYSSDDRCIDKHFGEVLPTAFAGSGNRSLLAEHKASRISSDVVPGDGACALFHHAPAKECCIGCSLKSGSEIGEDSLCKKVPDAVYALELIRGESFDESSLEGFRETLAGINTFGALPIADSLKDLPPCLSVPTASG